MKRLAHTRTPALARSRRAGAWLLPFILCLVLPLPALAARTHVVQRGETLSSIAGKYGVTVGELARANRLRDADLVKRGQQLTIPDNPGASWTGSHTVSSGETLSSIAALYGVSVEDLSLANNLQDANLVRRGQVLLVPSRETRRSAGQAEPPPAASPPDAAGDASTRPKIHVVVRGDTLSSIAASYGVTVRDLARMNELRDADLLQPGEKLAIPQGALAFIEHRVMKGESLAGIAARYKVALADIRAANTLADPDLIKPGQVLRIPASDTALEAGEPAAAPAPPATSDPRRRLPAAIRAAIDSADVARGRWKHIVIHHSGTDVGSGKSMDRYHREERNMENGLAYHFVIGNGNGMNDGSIFVGRRWNEQLDGGHVVSPELNHTSIGICLVGDFETGPPTRRQMASLDALVRALLRRTDLGPGAVTTHTLIHPKHTLCPGKYFPTESFRERLRQG